MLVTAAYFATRPVVGIGWQETLRYILLDSLNSPLWYLLDLMTLALFTPIIYLLMKKLWFLALPLACLCGVWGGEILAVRAIGICMFSIGSFLAIQNQIVQRIKEKCRLYKKLLSLVLGTLWLGVLIVKSYYLCTLPASVLQTGQYTAWLEALNGINIVLGIPAVWLLYDKLSACRSIKRTRFGKYGMMLFVMHHPIISVVKKLLMLLLGNSMFMTLVCYGLSAAVTVVIVLAISVFLRKYANGFYKLISGGR